MTAGQAARLSVDAQPVLERARSNWEQSLVALDHLSTAEAECYVRLGKAQRRFSAAHRAWQRAEQAQDAARGEVVHAQQELYNAVAAHRDVVDGRGGPVHISVAMADLHHQLMGGRPGQLGAGS